MGGGFHGGRQTAIQPCKICQMISWSPIYAATIYTHVGVEKIKAFAYMLHIGKRAYHAYMPYLQSARWVIATCLYGLDFFFLHLCARLSHARRAPRQHCCLMGKTRAESGCSQARQRQDLCSCRSIWGRTADVSPFTICLSPSAFPKL